MSHPPDIVYFGDSYTDDGNLRSFFDGLVPDFIRDGIGGPTGAVSDGPTHATYTSQLTGASTANYAVAAARADGTLTVRDIAVSSNLLPFLLVPLSDPRLDVDINLSAQVGRFLGDSAGQDLSGTDAFLLIGGNDYLAVDPDSPTVIADLTAALNGAVTATFAATAGLLAAGVGGVTISALPAAGYTPSFSDLSLPVQQAVEFTFDAHNALLEEGVAGLELLGLDVNFIDLAEFSRAMIDDPTGFGFIAPYEDTLTGSTVLLDFDPDQVAFFDDIHQSTAHHAVIGAFNARAFDGAVIADLGDQVDVVTFGAEDDIAFGQGRNDQLQGAGGSDVLFGGTGSDRLLGGDDDDILSGGQSGDLLMGDEGGDILSGGMGNDRLSGGDGDDVLIDGTGTDFVMGGDGDDTFIWIEAGLIGGTAGTDTDRLLGGGGTDTLYVVLDSAPTDAADGGPAVTPDFLASLGVRTADIENFVLLDGREGLAALAGESWFAEADAWNLI
jgi:phospholipase/lecithinase/hemolysin